MQLTTKDFPAVTKEVNSQFNTSMKQRVQSSFGLKLFGVSKTNLLDHKHLLMHGMGKLRKIGGEGAEYGISGSREGDSITWTQEGYQDGAAITKKMRMFWRSQNGSFMSQIKTLTENAFDTIDQSMADVLSYGEKTSYVNAYGDTVAAVAPNGLPLFSRNHTTKVSKQTFDNVVTAGATVNPALSADALSETIVRGMKQRRPVADNDAGNASAINIDTLLIPAELYPRAVALIESAKVAGSNNNDTNKFLNKLKIKVWSRLGVTAAGDEMPDAFYLYDSSRVKESIQAKFAQKPRLDAPEKVYMTKNWVWTLDVWYALGCGWPMYIFKSTGKG